MSIACLRVLSMAVVVLLSQVALASVPTEVTSCGQIVTGAAFLSTDLDCSGFAGESVLPDYSKKGYPYVVTGAAVLISRKGTLDLRGHTLTGGQFGVFCGKSCTVLGGGTVTGASLNAVFAGKNLTVRDTTISNSGDTALFVQRILRIYDSVITGNRYVTWFSNTVEVVRSIVTGSTEFGITADKIELVDSTVTGNGLDLGSKRKPRLKNSTCGTSSWGPEHRDVCGAP